MDVKHKFHTTPYAHQVEALEESMNRAFYAYLLEMGMGKSKILIDNIVNLYLQGDLKFALILAPKGVYQNWPNKELPEHMSPDIPHRVILWRASPTKRQAEEMRSVSAPFEGLTLFVMNIEAASTKKGKAALLWFAKTFGKGGMVGVDESSTIKNPAAARTKALCSAARGFDYRRILTGSPTSNSPLDIYSQAEFLQEGLLGPSFYAFRARYAVLKKRKLGAHISFEEVIGYRRLDELAERLKEFSYRRLKEECLDLPEKIYVSRTVEMTPEQLKIYGELVSHAFANVDEDQSVSVPQAITDILRRQQVICGHVKTDDGEIIQLKSNRVAETLAAIEECQGKVIIWARFRNDIRILQEALSEAYGKHAVVSYYGDTSSEDRAAAVRDFQDMDSPVRFFVGNQSTAGYGITLTAARNVIYFSNSFSLEHRLQSEDRCHRIGQAFAVTYIDLITENTVDEKIVRALLRKIDISAQVLGEEARQWLTVKP